MILVAFDEGMRSEVAERLCAAGYSALETQQTSHDKHENNDISVRDS